MKFTLALICFVVAAVSNLQSLLFAAGADNLGGVIVYPNPYKPSEGHNSVVFDNLTDNVRLRVYKVTGELVYDNSYNNTGGKAQWDGCNNDGKVVSSGLYYYIVTGDSGSKAAGKLVILR